MDSILNLFEHIGHSVSETTILLYKILFALIENVASDDIFHLIDTLHIDCPGSAAEFIIMKPKPIRIGMS